MSPGDHARLRNYRTWAALQAQDYRTALAVVREADIASRFDLYFAARTASDAYLAAPDQYRDTAQDTLMLLRNADAEGKTGHPYDLIWRERGVLEWKLEGNDRKATEAYRRSGEALREMDSSAPIVRWLNLVLDAHQKALNEEAFSANGSVNGGALQPLLAKAKKSSDAGRHILPALRNVSPL